MVIVVTKIAPRPVLIESGLPPYHDQVSLPTLLPYAISDLSCTHNMIAYPAPPIQALKHAQDADANLWRADCEQRPRRPPAASGHPAHARSDTVPSHLCKTLQNEPHWFSDVMTHVRHNHSARIL